MTIYSNEMYSLEREEEANLPTGQVMLSKSGQELVNVVGGNSSQVACSSAMEYWTKKGWTAKKL